MRGPPALREPGQCGRTPPLHGARGRRQHRGQRIAAAAAGCGRAGDSFGNTQPLTPSAPLCPSAGPPSAPRHLRRPWAGTLRNQDRDRVTHWRGPRPLPQSGLRVLSAYPPPSPLLRVGKKGRRVGQSFLSASPPVSPGQRGAAGTGKWGAPVQYLLVAPWQLDSSPLCPACWGSVSERGVWFRRKFILTQGTLCLSRLPKESPRDCK